MATRTLNLPVFLGDTPQPIEAPATLSEQRYIIKLYWSPLAGGSVGLWVSDLADAAGVVVAPTVPLVLTDDLWAIYKGDARVPQGSLAVVRVSGATGTNPGPEELGASVELRYTD